MTHLKMMEYEVERSSAYCVDFRNKHCWTCTQAYDQYDQFCLEYFSQFWLFVDSTKWVVEQFKLPAYMVTKKHSELMW